MDNQLQCTYKIDGQTSDPLYTSSFSRRFSKSIEANPSSKNAMILATTDKGISEEVYEVEFQFFGEQMSATDSQEITDAIASGQTPTIPNLKSAREQADKLERLLRKKGRGELTHPQNPLGENPVKVVVLSMSEKVEFLKDIGIITISVSFIPSIAPPQNTETTTANDVQTKTKNIVDGVTGEVSETTVEIIEKVSNNCSLLRNA